MGKMLMIAGAALIVVGALLHFGGQFLSLGQLPGDFKWTRGHTTVYVPLATSVLLSVVLTVLAQLWLRR